MPDEAGPPSFREFAKMAWARVTKGDERELKQMGRVRYELMQVVYSHMTDEHAVAHLKEFVEADPGAAQATLSYVDRTRARSPAYDTDRAHRILLAAINGAPPAPVEPEGAELFERERELGWTPLETAFHQLAGEVPELGQIAALVESRPGSTASIRRVLKFVGPRSAHDDPLLRSPLALTVASRYLDAVKRNDHAALQRPVWEHGQGKRGGRPRE